MLRHLRLGRHLAFVARCEHVFTAVSLRSSLVRRSGGGFCLSRWALMIPSVLGTEPEVLRACSKSAVGTSASSRAGCGSCLGRVTTGKRTFDEFHGAGQDRADK